MKKINKHRSTITICSTLIFGALCIPSISYANTKQIAPTSSESIEAVQQELQKHLDNREKNNEIRYITTNFNREEVLDKLIAVYNNLLEKDDYLKYTIKRTDFTMQGESGAYTMTLNTTYRETKEQSQHVKEQSKLIVDSIINPQMNDHEKVKEIHDYVVKHVSYDKSLQSYTAYEAVVNRSAVCQGYALLTYQLLKEAGIPARIVEGTANGELHAWNLVNIESKWYHLDSTFDDPTPDKENQATYSHFNLSDEQIKNDHQWNHDKYPAATTSYYDELMNKVQINDEKLTSYQKLLKDTNLIYLKSEYSAENYEQLINNIQSQFISQPEKITLRYNKSVNNTIKDAKLVLNTITWPEGAKNVSFEAEPFNHHQGSSLLTIVFTY
ncbi:transglutaminase domain-containing protein [Bacillus sp. FDAARGOS_1420]|uniref:transglutaminase domain-containing protein n=1 Tax=unclassified Bacillus (in: firmicutes) TaxID=185979 RepID=UPI001C5B38D9|nr:transglutaminase domain-containing protein [Bacillus sp. FDAARGOS_1420]MBW3496722.1 peptidase [Bacillus sp. FDAARGOS_1420]